MEWGPDLVERVESPNDDVTTPDPETWGTGPDAEMGLEAFIKMGGGTVTLEVVQ